MLIAQGLIAPILPRFLTAHRQVKVLMEVTNRPVDVIEEGFDVAIRVRPVIEDSSLVARSFGKSQGALVASPELLDSVGRPQSSADLSRFDSLSLPANDGRFAWRLSGPDDALEQVGHTPRLVADDMLLLKQAAVAGVGIVLLPVSVCSEELRSGQLEVVLPDRPVPPGNLHAVYPSRRGLVPAVRSFIDFLAKELPAIVSARAW